MCEKLAQLDLMEVQAGARSEYITKVARVFSTKPITKDIRIPTGAFHMVLQNK